MESKFVSKARSALAKAERVLTDIKADFVAEFSSQGSEGARELPWVGRTDFEKSLEAECERRILEISKSPDFLARENDGRVHVDMCTARAVLEYDENLRQLKWKYVPQEMKEKDFWKRYFAAVQNVKEELYVLEAKAAPEMRSPELKPLESTSEAESPRKDPADEEAYMKASTMVAVPPSVVLRRLAAAIDFSRGFETMKDLAGDINEDKESSQGDNWPSSFASGLAAVRRLSSREKDGKVNSRSKDAERYRALVQSLFLPDTHEGKSLGYLSTCKATFPEELHGAPPESFVAQLAEVIAGLKTEQIMAKFWLEIVNECRRYWETGLPIPRIPIDGNPDLRYCLLHQQLQIINCCIARRKRRACAVESLNALQDCQSRGPDENADSMLFAKLEDGNLAPRLGVEHRSADLCLLATGEPVFSPVTQEGPLLTEDMIRESEELVMRTGSFGAGCSHLFSDMQAFKAANPGCILEDFVRWYSPLDWRKEPESSNPVDEHKLVQEASLRGHLSTRMRSEGNLWQELWFSARPLPAVMQAPLFDEELSGETMLDALENINPTSFFEQLFIAVLSVGFSIAERAPSAEKDALSLYFNKECKDYVLSTCHRDMKSETLQDLCEVYELMEAAVHAPPEGLLAANVQKQVTAKLRKTRGHFTELGRFLTKRQHQQPQQPQQPQQLNEQCEQSLTSSSEGPVSSVMRFLESKASLFDRKAKQTSERKAPVASENDWTIV